jgi:hypothetical protein
MSSRRCRPVPRGKGGVLEDLRLWVPKTRLVALFAIGRLRGSVAQCVTRCRHAGVARARCVVDACEGLIPVPVGVERSCVQAKDDGIEVRVVDVTPTLPLMSQTTRTAFTSFE